MLEECIKGLNIDPAGIYVDGTAGGAGHSREIASRLTGGRLISLDKDPDAVAVATERLKGYPAQVVREDFTNIPSVLDGLGIEKVNGVMLDLGVSSFQLDNPERGFSYMADAPLDMRMSKEGLSAYDIVNGSDVYELTRILREYGEEKFAYQIAKNIVRQREKAPVATTGELAEIVRSSIPNAARREGGNPSKRTFQAIRIEVNDELERIPICIDGAFERLAVGGRLVILTFHSLEDRIVKNKFAEKAKGCTCPPEFPVCVCGKTPQGRLVTKKPIEASEEEKQSNSRSRSAKLRIIEKL